MLSLKNKIIIKNATKQLYSQLAAVSSEYTDKPCYPNILDLSSEGRKFRERQKWYDAVKNIKTIEEKLLKINMPKYYGYKPVMLTDQKYPYNCLPLTQHYTRTFFEESENLPNFYKKFDPFVETWFKSIASNVIESIEFANECYMLKYNGLSARDKARVFGETIVQQINRELLIHLSTECRHLSEIEMDINPRHEAFWWTGGILPTKMTRKSKEGQDWCKDKADDLVDRSIQYIGSPYLTLRHRFPLEAFENEAFLPNETRSQSIPVYKYDARTLGYSCDYRHGTNIPGFWPGNPMEFGLLSYQKRDHMTIRNSAYGVEDSRDALHAQGIQSSFAWLFSQACYQGFSSYQDITYPLSAQTVVTDGQFWSFYVYQLNTTLISSDFYVNNPKTNVCWGTKEIKLFEKFDENGKCIGFNENVLKNLIYFYMNNPVKREINMKPFLGTDEQKISDIKDDERRIFLERVYKHMTSNRPKHLLVPEVYMWEKIYKIDNNTRPLDSRRRFFETGLKPFKRQMDHHTPVYIPKSLRPMGPKIRKRWQRTYYP